MTSYYVLISDDLIASRDMTYWPACLRLVEAEPGVPFHGARWWLVDDDEAPDELEGLRVELTLARFDDDPAVITIRQPISHWRGKVPRFGPQGAALYG